MPTYEYLCRACGDRIEVVQSFSDDPLTVCEACGGELRKVFSAAGLIFKGSGWHVKDYASSGSGGSGSPATKDGAGKDGAGAKASEGTGSGGDAGAAASSSTSSSTSSKGSTASSGD